MIDLVIVTEKACLNSSNEVRHSAMAIEEDETLIRAFSEQGIRCKRVAWEDSEFDWSSTRVALIKSTWNYFYHIQEFKLWLEKVSRQCKLINSKDLVLWNMDKNYLLELNEKGINIPETHLLDANKDFDPDYWNDKLGGLGVVVKPRVSGGSKDTYYLKPPFNESEIASVKVDIQRQSMMIQPFISSIVENGETSLVFINGQFTHAKVKKPKSDDFRVQPYHGGTLHEYSPTKEEYNFGRKALEACKQLKEMPFYVRVDFCKGTNGENLLMEFEAVEPQLWYPESEMAVSALVEGIKNILK